MIIRIFNGFLLRITLPLVIIALAATIFLPSLVSSDLDDALVLSSSAGVVVMFARAFWAAVTRAHLSRADQLIAGIYLAWLSNGIGRMVAIANKFWPGFLGDYADDVSMWLRFALFVAAIFHVTAPGDDPKAPHYQAKAATVSVVAGIALAGAIVGARALTGRW